MTGHRVERKTTVVVEGATVIRGGETVLTRVNAVLQSGTVVAVVGANGAGKTTLLKAIAGLLPLSSGRVTLDGTDLAAMPRMQLAQTIAYLPQSRAVHWPMSVRSIVMLGRIPHGSRAFLNVHRDEEAVVDAMKRMNVMHLAERPIATLSGGEQARVLLARALAQNTPMIIADEPTAGLDPLHAIEVFEHFKALASDRHTIVTAVHDLSLAANYATHAIVLREGKCIESGLIAQALSTATLTEAFGLDARIMDVGATRVVLMTRPLA